jgi:hypothetical protein
METSNLGTQVTFRSTSFAAMRFMEGQTRQVGEGGLCTAPSQEDSNGRLAVCHESESLEQSYLCVVTGWHRNVVGHAQLALCMYPLGGGFTKTKDGVIHCF